MNIMPMPRCGEPGVQHAGQTLSASPRAISRIPFKPLFLATAMACASLGLSAGELPQIHEVVSGTATISQDGKSMQIQTQTGRTAIDWKNFSIGADNKVHFHQPDGSSITLNRVVGGKPSNIFGMLTSNGKLVLLNPAGIWFGPRSRISSSSLIAGAGMITDEQVRKFSETGKLNIQLQGGVRNQGEIRVDGGGSVTLLGAQVENQGVIQALKGQVNLATGPRATLDFHGDGLLALAVDGEPGDAASVDPALSGGVHNSGHIDVGGGVVAMSSQRAARHLESVISVGGSVVADSVSEQGGTIVLGNAERTQVSGALSARGSEGGSIKVLGEQVALTDTARLDASGTRGRGGSVLVGGNFQGSGSEQRAQSTTVAPGAQLRADGKTDGGLVVAWSDGDTQFSGSASARGGERGGLVETSGKRLTVGSEARVDTAGGRQAGTWLLDPEVINIETLDAPGAVAASTLVEALRLGNVEVAATQRINVNAPIVAREVFRTVDSQGNPTGATLALIAAGNPTQGRGYLDAAGNAADLHDDSGSVHINAPILLAGGNLFIAATGDVRLVNLTPGQTGDAAMSRRAIVDVGDGIIWIKTSNVATISQDAGTALIGDRVALEGASVRMESELNYAGTLAGKASNGVFRFYQTNASGTTATGTVQSPFSAESLTGVTAQQLRYVGAQEIVADVGYNPTSKDVTLTAGGESFDYLVFEATGFVGADGQPLPPDVLLNYLDSSDYLVDGLSFTVNGKVWKFVPDAGSPELTQFYVDGQLQGSLPIGFAISGNGGLQVVSTVSGATGWGVQPYAHIPGAHNQAEIQHDSQTGASQQLVISLGERVDQVQALLGWLIDDGIWNDPPVDPNGPTSNVLRERAVVHYLRTEEAPGDIALNASKAHVTVQADDASRTYGDANPDWQSRRSDNQAMQAIREVDSFVDRQLGQQRSAFEVQHSSSATERSNVGQYAIDGQLSSAGSRVDRRFEVSLGEAHLTITPAPLVLTADSHAKQVGDADPALSYRTQGWKFDSDRDAAAFTLTRDPGESPGNYRVFEQDGTRMISANYQVTVVDGNLAINGPVAPEPKPKPDPIPDPRPEPQPDPSPTPEPPAARPQVGGSLAGGGTSERCTAIESPSSVTAGHTVSPAIVRTYSVQLICKPRAYGNGDAERQLPDRIDLINYANAWLKDGRFQLPDWNRSVIPRDLPGRDGGKR